MAGPSNLFGFGCCTDEPPPPDCCGLTIHLQDYRTGDPLSGGVVTNAITGEVLGMTDGDGNFTFPTSFGGYYGLTYDGYLFTDAANCSRFNCGQTLIICFCLATVVVTASAPVTFSQSSIGNADCSNGIILRQSDITETSITYTNVAFAFCAPFFFCLPMTITVRADPIDPDTYLNNCISFVLNCDDTQTQSIDLFDYSADYIHTGFGSASGGSVDFDCDTTCDTHGEGPLFRGLTPKVLYMTWSAKATGTGADLSSVYFGSYAGVPIAVTYNPATTGWTSGCLGGGGILCNPDLPYISKLFKSVQTGIGPGAIDNIFGGFYFVRYGDSDCGLTPQAPDECAPSPINANNSPICALGSPVDFIASSGDLGGHEIFVHIME